MTDRWTVRAVVLLLGVAVLLALGIAGYLAANDHGVPDFIVATGAAALGALSALLAKTSTEPRSDAVDTETVPPTNYGA